MSADHAGQLHDKPLAGHHQYLHEPVHGKTCDTQCAMQASHQATIQLSMLATS